MGASTKIQWCDHTFNAWWGCIEDGPECDHCYARSFAKRTGHDVWGLGGRRFFGEKHWAEPLKWNAEACCAGIRARVFCGSMMDIGECRSDDVGAGMDRERAKLWLLIEQTPWLDWLLLSKRPQNFMRVFPTRWLVSIPRNVWLGTTAGTLNGWQKRVRHLRKLNPHVRFVSVEPQLEDMGDVDLAGIDWLIQGGESGGGAREFNAVWASRMRDLCAKAGVAYFLKQLGAAPVAHTGLIDLGRAHLRDRKGGDWSEWPESMRVRQFPKASAAE